MDDLLAEFLTETDESISVIDAQLVELEKNPNDAEILNNIFRLMHTIKGTCGFLGLPRLEKVAHAGENLLDKFREGMEVTPDAVTLILTCIDTIKELLAELEENGTEPEGDDQALIDQLNALASGEAAPAAAPAAEEAAPVEAAPAASGPVIGPDGIPVAAELLAEVEAAQAAGAKAASDDEMMAEMAAENESGGDAAPVSSGPVINDDGIPVAAELLAEVEAAQAAGVKAASEADLQAEMEAERAKDAAKAAQAKAAVPAEAKKAAPAKAAAPAGEKKEPSAASSSIRVNVDLLENLMTLISELVLTRNSLLQMARSYEDSEFTVPLQRLSNITTDLQEGVMKTRMQPIGNAWAKLPRIVRDLAIETGKKIDLQMLGAETELDRQVLELIKDPLTHMVRNSADHGLEGPEGRVAAGKREMGVITLNAFHEGGHIIIEIKDDGRGLNMDRIRQKCIENGLASDAELESMTDTQIQQYIFKPGFSTAEKITSVSGRGVGMDVVRTNIEKIGGTIELKSVEGKGSTFTIKIPLTLAIVSALIVECGKERFAIPQISVLELVRASNHSEHAVEMINNSPVLRLRNRLLPLVNMSALLELDGEDDEPNPNDELFIVVSQVGTYTFGIIVDRVFDTEEIVVKPTAPILREIPYYSGNTILGDGSVIMILDPNGIASASGASSRGGDTTDQETETIGHESVDKTSLLIFRAGGDELKAVPLALVARLEEIEMQKVERAHGDYVVQYRGSLMPLIPFHVGHQWKTEGRQPVLVFTEGERSMGLVVDEIVDIVEDRLKVEIQANVPGLIGSAIIDGKATDVVDTGYYLTQAFADWFGSEETVSLPGSVGGKKRALLVDDSPFFRNLLTPVLSVAGYQVTAVANAGDALAIRENGGNFDVIISDIEMPDMTGFEFAQEVRGDSRWQDVPMVALSSHVSDQAFEQGREVGFDDYIAKSDRDALVRTLAQTVAQAMRGAQNS